MTRSRTAIPTEAARPQRSAALAPLALPASWAYRAALRARNRRFDRGQGVERLDRPVISIGNITLGGTGKSPLVAWIAQVVLDAGGHPVIAMRGYKARKGESSDEEQEYRERFGDLVPVLATPDRAAALRALFVEPAHVRRDCVILDDGFQHRRLARNLDLVIIDATQDTFNDRVIPAGRLREPLHNLRRADSVIVSRAESIDSSLSHMVERHHGRPPVAWTRHSWTGLELAGRETGTVDPQWLSGKRVVAMFGVGNPGPVEQMVRELGASIRRRMPVRDHQHYTERFLNDEIRPACADRWIDALIVTPKDWVKLRSLLDWSRWPATVVIPRLQLDFIAGEDALRDRILATAKASMRDGAASREAASEELAPEEPARAD
jgi:tetraacyldisaccharide 4'-kinase